MIGLTPAKRAKALRMLLARLLDSDFSAAELRQIASEFDRRDLGGELAFLIQRAAEGFRDDEKKRPSSIDEGLVKQANSAVRSRKMPRGHILRLIDMISPNVASEARDTGESLTVTFRKLFKTLDHDMAEKFLDMLKGSEEQDPYLAGIGAKR